MGCELVFFFVIIYKLFKIYITRSLQYNYCLVWLYSSSFKSIFLLFSLPIRSLTNHGDSLFFACAGWQILMNRFILSKHLRENYLHSKFVVRCSLGAQQIGYFIWIIYFFSLTSNYSTENVQHLAKQICNSNTTQHKWWLEWILPLTFPHYLSFSCIFRTVID